MKTRIISPIKLDIHSVRHASRQIREIQMYHRSQFQAKVRLISVLDCSKHCMIPFDCVNQYNEHLDILYSKSSKNL